jgi:hypothetical protein
MFSEVERRQVRGGSLSGFQEVATHGTDLRVKVVSEMGRHQIFFNKYIVVQEK